MGTFWLICPNLYWVCLLGTFQTFLGTKKVFSHLCTAKKPEGVREALECCVCAPATLESRSYLSLLCLKNTLIQQILLYGVLTLWTNFTDQITDITFVGYNVNPSVFGH